MKENVFDEVKNLISAYIEVPKHELDMSANLDLTYDMDSTEMTEFAKEIEQKFNISASKSERSSWESGLSICQFIMTKQADSCV